MSLYDGHDSISELSEHPNVTVASSGSWLDAESNKPERKES